MEQIGVEAVVAGLKSFLGDMKKVDSSIASLIPGSDLLKRAFSGLGGIVEWLTGSVFRVLEYTLGNLIAGAIQTVVSEIQELISTTIEAGSEFQSLEIRLRNFNLNTLVESGKDYNTAFKESIELTKEQLTWVQKLAATTPYDLTDIANVFTLARSYGFAADESKNLTQDITSFAAGMGLGNTEIERIIVNFGQMVQQGKVTQREMNDLARGAFVPVNDILKVMQEQTGLTSGAFDDFRNSAEGVDAFMKAFSTLVGQRFTGATQAMAQTWKGATDNVKDFIRSLLGLNVVKPILDVLGKNIAEFITAFTQGPKWDAVVSAATRIGTAASDIVSRILNIGSGAEAMAERFLGAVEGVANWLESNSDKIVGWAVNLKKWVEGEAIPAVKRLFGILFGTGEKKGAIQLFGEWAQNTLLPFLQAQLFPVLSDLSDMIFGTDFSVFSDSISNVNSTPLQNILQIIVDLKPLVAPLLDLFSALGSVIIAAFSGDETQTFGEFVRDTLVPAIKDLANWVRQNADLLAILLKAFIALQIMGTILGLVTALVVQVALFVFQLASLIATVTVAVAAFRTIAFVWNLFINTFKSGVETIGILVLFLITKFQAWKANWTQIINEVAAAFQNKDWGGIGRAIIDGLIRGFQSGASQLINLVRSLAQNAITTFKANLGIKSPSTIFAGIGENLMQGFANGILDTASLAADAMKKVTSSTIAIGAMAPSQMASKMAPSSISTVTTNNYNLQVNTSAPSEPVIQDFNMLSSLAGN